MSQDKLNKLSIEIEEYKLMDEFFLVLQTQEEILNTDLKPIKKKHLVYYDGLGRYRAVSSQALPYAEEYDYEPVYEENHYVIEEEEYEEEYVVKNMRFKIEEEDDNLFKLVYLGEV